MQRSCGRTHGVVDLGRGAVQGPVGGGPEAGAGPGRDAQAVQLVGLQPPHGDLGLIAPHLHGGPVVIWRRDARVTHTFAHVRTLSHTRTRTHAHRRHMHT